MTRSGPIAALDVGSTKVCCVIAQLQEDGSPRIVGIGHQVARGMRSGAVVDMDDLEHSIRASVAAAEDMANQRIRAVVVNVSGGQPVSSEIEVEVGLNGHPVDETDLRSMLDSGRAHHQSTERDLLHAIPLDYVIDGNDGIRDPRGMYGAQLGVTIHLITAANGPVRNLSAVIGRCHLDIEARVVSPYAAGLACLVDDERNMGSICIDMGGGTTSIAAFVGGKLAHTDILPIGGQHVTSDIARCLSTPMTWAERLKTLFGSAIPAPGDDREMLSVPLVGEDEEGASHQVPRSFLNQIIQPRLEETFELVRARVEQGCLGKEIGRRVVLTGGASQMQGVRELAALVLDKQVRLGRPIAFQGLPEATGGPAFSACAGLVRYAVIHQSPRSGRRDERGGGSAETGLGRIGQWLKKNF